ncbi:MAG: adenylate/guanylate cyclase domain-containing protein [Pseudomonadota bacterium]
MAAKSSAAHGPWRWTLTLIGVGITLAWAALTALQVPFVHGFLSSLDNQLVDLRLQLRGAQKPATPVVIAALDEKSLDEVGRWPWPRPVVAQLLEAIGRSGAGVIGLDLGFFEAEGSLALGYIQEERQKAAEPGEQQLLDRLAGRLAGDRALGQAVAYAPAPIVPGYFLHMTNAGVGHISAEEAEARRRELVGAAYRFVSLLPGVNEADLPVPTAFLAEPNVPELMQASPAIGYFNVLPDPDGNFRSVPLVIRLNQRPAPEQAKAKEQAQGPAQVDYLLPLTLSMIHAYEGRTAFAQLQQLRQAEFGLKNAIAQNQVSEAEAREAAQALDQARKELIATWSDLAPRLTLGPYGVVEVRVGGQAITPQQDGSLRLNFRGPRASFPTYSWTDILHGRLPADALKDKLVVVGGSAVGVGDVRPTPFDPQLPGPEIHATALDNILSGQWLLRPDWALGADLAAVLILGLLASFIMPRLSAARALGMFTLLALGLIAFNHWFAFVRHRWELSLVYPMLSLFTAFITLTALSFLKEEGEKRKVRRAFAFYLSEDVIEAVLKDPSRLRLGGQRRALSIYFSDLQGFTSISEKLDPEQLTGLLNDYLGDMTDIILEEGGTLDKYEGDAIIAFWNAPLDQPDHYMRAVRASLRCQQKLAERRAEFRERAGVDLYMRIGLNSGEVVVGNMGSAKRFDYTMLGDAANLASRLEGANKVFGTYLMASEATWGPVSDELAGRELGRLRVVGRKVPVKVFEPLGVAGQTDLAPWEPFVRGLELVGRGDWDAAAAAFAALPEDSASRTYLKRCQELSGQPPEAWDGVWNLTSK